MYDLALAIWMIIVLIVMLNGCAAGVIAILHIRRSTMRRGSRVAIAAAVTGFLPVSLVIPFAIADLGPTGSEGPLVVFLGLTMILGVGMLFSLPGALILARKLEAPGGEYRAFE